MAFILTPLPPSRSSRPSTSPRMSATPISRRSALKLAAISFATFSTRAFAETQLDLKELKEELKEDVEALKYDEEVVDVGPDAAEKNITRIKKQGEPEFQAEYEADAKEIKEESKEKYGEMLAEEKADAERIKASFAK